MSSPNITPASLSAFASALAEAYKRTEQVRPNRPQAAAASQLASLASLVGVFAERSRGLEEFHDGGLMLVKYFQPILSKIRTIGTGSVLGSDATIGTRAVVCAGVVIVLSAPAVIVSTTQLHILSPTYTYLH